MNQYVFPVRLPNPENLYTPDIMDVQVYNPQVAPPPTVPMQQPVITYPGLFAIGGGGGEFHPVQGINFIFMEDMLRLQALFAARQFLTTRCLERGLPGVSEGNPFITTTTTIARGTDGGTIACLFSELSLLSATLGVISSEILLGPRRADAQTAYQDFAWDLLAYAPWIRFPNGSSSDIHAMVAQGQAKLRELRDLIDTYRDAQLNFQQQQGR